MSVTTVAAPLVKVVARISTRARKQHVAGQILNQDGRNRTTHPEAANALVVSVRISGGLGALGVAEAGDIPGCGRGD